MISTISSLDFLLTNVICFAAGALAVVVLQRAGHAAYRAAERAAHSDA